MRKKKKAPLCLCFSCFCVCLLFPPPLPAFRKLFCLPTLPMLSRPSYLLVRGARLWNQTASCEKRKELLFMLFSFLLTPWIFFLFFRLLQVVLFCLGEFFAASLSYLLARLATDLRSRKKKKSSFVFFFSLGSVDFFFFLPPFASCFVSLCLGESFSASLS
uniref:Uncharacterized protein n=1 Tax=Ixodes ricinus TaxID=34613 RepID=A0A6B0UX14_IXORI